MPSATSSNIRVEHIIKKMPNKLCKLYEPSSSSKNIAYIFLHGFLGNPIKTWGLDEDNKFWPVELGMETNASVYIFNYENHWFGRKKNASLSLQNVADKLILEIISDCNDYDSIIFFTHSFGGLIFKELCIKLHNGDPLPQRILNKLDGLCAFSCPNFGSKWANLFSIPMLFPSYNLKTLRRNGLIVKKLDENFSKIIRSKKFGDFSIRSYGELGYVYYLFRVSPDDARFLNIDDNNEHTECPENHFNICKNIHCKEDTFLEVKMFVNNLKSSAANKRFLPHIPE